MQQAIVHIALVVRDYERLRANGVTFIREPKEEDYGTVAVFADLYGNPWDVLQLRPGHRVALRAAMGPARA